MTIQWLFDVDGVLCDTGSVIDAEFKDWFIDWAKDKDIYLVTGSEREKTICQIGQEIVDMATMTFNCMGNSIWIKDREFRVNQFDLIPDELAWLENKVTISPYHTRTGNHVVCRPGSINFSILGRNANATQRLEYRDWDRTHGERLSLIQELKERFPRLNAFIGGDISIDICLRGADKGQVIQLLPDRKPIHFFADRCKPYEIDYPLLRRCENRDTVFEVDGYKRTWEILRSL
jgi:phosphomannomutase